MTVAELIELLKQMPASAPVFRGDGEWGPMAVTHITLNKDDASNLPGVVVIETGEVEQWEREDAKLVLP